MKSRSKKAGSEHAFDLQITFTPAGKSKRRFNLTKVPGTTTYSQLQAMLHKETQVLPANQKIMSLGKNLAGDGDALIGGKPLTSFFGAKKKKVRLLLMDGSKALEKAKDLEAKVAAARSPPKKPKPASLKDIEAEASSFSERAVKLTERIAQLRSKGVENAQISAQVRTEIYAFNRLTQLLELLDKMKMDDRQQYDDGGGREVIRKIQRITDNIDQVQQSLK